MHVICNILLTHRELNQLPAVKLPGSRPFHAQVVGVRIPDVEGVAAFVIVCAFVMIARIPLALHTVSGQNAFHIGMGLAEVDVLNNVINIVALGVTFEDKVHVPSVGVAAASSVAAAPTPAVLQVSTNTATLLGDLEAGIVSVKTKAVALVACPPRAMNWLRRQDALLVMVGHTQWDQNPTASPIIVVHFARQLQLHAPSAVPLINAPHAQSSGVVRIIGIPVDAEAISMLVVCIGSVPFVPSLLPAVHVGEGLATVLSTTRVLPNVLDGDPGLVHGQLTRVVLLCHFEAKDSNPLSNCA